MVTGLSLTELTASSALQFGIISHKHMEVNMIALKMSSRASLVAQWLRIRLPMRGTQVQALVQKDPTCHGAAGPVRHNYWTCTLEPTSHNCWAHVPQLLGPTCLEPVLHNGRGHCDVRPTHHREQWPPLAATRESRTQQWRTNAAKNK